MDRAEGLRGAVARLEAAGVEGAARDARRLMAAASGSAALPAEALGAEAANRFEAMVAQRAARQPMSHILGQRAFWKHEFIVTPDVLDPRPDTETLVEAALEAPFERVLDLGTGSGAILLSLLSERPEATGVGTDTSAAALDVARRNAARLGLDPVLRQADWFDGLAGEGPFDLIVSNPPYIPAGDMPGLAPELSFEPRGALTDEADGLSAYRAIAAGAADWLIPKGRLVVEHGAGQSDAVRDVFQQAGLVVTGVRKDLDRRDRVVLAEKPG